MVDRNPRSRLLVAATITRHFPEAVIVEVGDDIADALRESEVAHAVVGIFTNALTARIFAGLVRETNPRVPILILSDTDCKAEVLEAGATEFLHTDQWLLAGSVLDGLLREKTVE